VAKVKTEEKRTHGVSRNQKGGGKSGGQGGLVTIRNKNTKKNHTDTTQTKCHTDQTLENTHEGEGEKRYADDRRTWTPTKKKKDKTSAEGSRWGEKRSEQKGERGQTWKLLEV